MANFQNDFKFYFNLGKEFVDFSIRWQDFYLLIFSKVGREMLRRLIFTVGVIYTWNIPKINFDIRKILKELRKKNPYGENDILILAGDLCWNIDIFKTQLKEIKGLFRTVIFVPGNSEYRLDWHKKEKDYDDSLEKMKVVDQICDELGVIRKPTRIGDSKIVIFPVLGWYTPHFDSKYDGDVSYHRKWLDFRTIFFPKDVKDDPYENHFKKLNEDAMNDFKFRPGDKVITCSHFLPRRDLLPNGMFLKYSLPFISGNAKMDEFIRSIRPRPFIHVFGHSHINCDCKISGIHYIQNALAHPSERKQFWKKFASTAPRLVYSLKRSDFGVGSDDESSDEDEGEEESEGEEDDDDDDDDEEEEESEDSDEV